MTHQNIFTLIFLAIILGAILGHAERSSPHSLSKELGLTPSCVKRVLATCSSHQPWFNHGQASSLASVHQQSNDQEKTFPIQEIAKNLSVELKDLFQFSKKCPETKECLENMKEKLVLFKNTIEETTLQFFHRFSNLTVEKVKEVLGQKNILEKIKSEMAQQDTIVDIKNSLVNVQEKIIEQNTDLSQIKIIQKTIQGIESKIQQQEKSLSEIKELLKKQHDTLNLVQANFSQQSTPRNCKDLLDNGDRMSGIRKVFPFASKSRGVSVFCDQSTDGGGWTVIQHREPLPKREDFFRTWDDYEKGFGNLTGEFWLGLEIIRALTSEEAPTELRVDLEDFDDKKRWAKYLNFFIDDASNKYKLHAGNYSGNAGNSLKVHIGMKFSTKDQDNDGSGDNCASKYHGAWWYINCHDSNLNGYPYEGEYSSSIQKGIVWDGFRGPYYSLKKTSMAVRAHT